ncbi:DNA-directed RNA polymerase subunit RPABC4 [Microdochium nivale]|nr:DNA-directed RNA polymerase subunit RPABC4 [Microdochium nivale]
MSREAYQVPTGSGSNFAGQGANATRAVDPVGEHASINYLCGDCGTKFPLKRNEAIRCRECGCRVLYKERTKRMVQFEAR